MPHFVQLSVIYAVLFFLITSSAFAQSSPGKILSKAVKINVNYETTFGNGSTVGKLAPSFMRETKRKHFHELELNSFSMIKSIVPVYNSVGQPIDEVITRKNDFGLRSQFTFNFLQKARLNPQVGISLLNQYLVQDTKPAGTSSYPRKYTQWNARLALCPQLRYNISTRCFADLSMPVDILHFGASFQVIRNPSIPARQQRNGGFEFDTMPDWRNTWYMRLGFGLKF